MLINTAVILTARHQINASCLIKNSYIKISISGQIDNILPFNITVAVILAK